MKSTSRTTAHLHVFHPINSGGTTWLKESDLVFKGKEQPSGYTEPLLHAWRLRVKSAAPQPA